MANRDSLLDGGQVVARCKEAAAHSTEAAKAVQEAELDVGLRKASAANCSRMRSSHDHTDNEWRLSG